MVPSCSGAAVLLAGAAVLLAGAEVVLSARSRVKSDGKTYIDGRGKEAQPEAKFSLCHPC